MAPPTVAGDAPIAFSGVRRSSRIGPTVSTDPGGSAITTVRPEYGNRLACENRAADPRARAESHGRFDPAGPAKHARSVTVAGASTVTVGRSIVAAHSAPIASQ